MCSADEGREDDGYVAVCGLRKRAGAKCIDEGLGKKYGRSICALLIGE